MNPGTHNYDEPNFLNRVFKLKIFLLTLLLVSSCHQDELTNQKSIASWSEKAPSSIKDLFKIRLAFGKTVAAALREKEFRDFIKQKSVIPDKQIFQELLFALVKDDVLPSGKSVSQLIRQYEDAEVKELFGETLMDRVAKDDPMVAIKLPDVFHKYNWNTDEVIPFVGVMTPVTMDNGYAFYYHNGYHEVIKEFEELFFENVKYFYVMLKYSTDYMQLNVNNMANEKKISLFELFPQFEYCQSDIVFQVLKSGIRNMDNPNIMILEKMKCHQIWKDICSYKGDFAFDDTPCGLPAKCPRDCDPNNPLIKNVVLTGFDVRKDIYILVNNLFEESANVTIDFFSYAKTDEYKRFVVPSVKFFELDKFNIDVKIKAIEMVYDHAKFKVPLVSITYTSIAEDSKWIPINALMYDDMSKDLFINYDYCVNLLFYNDLVSPVDVKRDIFYCLNENFTGNLILYPSRYRSVTSGSHDWCANSGVFVDNFSIGVSY